jgi:hypothetical protein
VSALDDVKPGTRVCIVGWGTVATLHTHRYIVDRQTKTLTITKRSDGGAGQRRFRTADGRSVPREPWGGTTAALTCQDPAPADPGADTPGGTDG